MMSRTALRTASLLAVLLAGSCAAPHDHEPVFQDGAKNHPITVEPAYRTLKVTPGPLSAADSAKLAFFVGEYLARGNGAISVSVPPGAQSSREIAMMGERLVDLGVPRSRILVGVQDDGSTDGRVNVGFVSYVAHTDPCGDWSENAAETGDNVPLPNFGCAVQHNLAAEVADPRDLVQSRGLGPAYSERALTVYGKYVQGEATGAQKTQEQSGAVSNVGNGQ